MLSWIVNLDDFNADPISILWARVDSTGALTEDKNVGWNWIMIDDIDGDDPDRPYHDSVYTATYVVRGKEARGEGFVLSDVAEVLAEKEVLESDEEIDACNVSILATIANLMGNSALTVEQRGRLRQSIAQLEEDLKSNILEEEEEEEEDDGGENDDGTEGDEGDEGDEHGSYDRDPVTAHPRRTERMAAVESRTPHYVEPSTRTAKRARHADPRLAAVESRFGHRDRMSPATRDYSVQDPYFKPTDSKYSE